MPLYHKSKDRKVSLIKTLFYRLLKQKLLKRKFREKIKRNFREKNGNYAKNTKILRKIHSLIVMVERMYFGRTDRNLKRELEKSNSLHQTFIKVKEEKLLI